MPTIRETTIQKRFCRKVPKTGRIGSAGCFAVTWYGGGYLVQGAGGREPNDYVKQTFRQCHEQVYLAPTDFHDALLLKLASLGPVFTRTADAYSRFFRPGSVVRKKLTYLMAILEVSPPYSRYFDGTDGPGKIGFLWGAAWRGVGLGFHLMVSAIFLLPLQVVAKLTGGPKGGGD